MLRLSCCAGQVTHVTFGQLPTSHPYCYSSTFLKTKVTARLAGILRDQLLSTKLGETHGCARTDFPDDSAIQRYHRCL